jgi:hypothetical protein
VYTRHIKSHLQKYRIQSDRTRDQFLEFFDRHMRSEFYEYLSQCERGDDSLDKTDNRTHQTSFDFARDVSQLSSRQSSVEWSRLDDEGSFSHESQSNSRPACADVCPLLVVATEKVDGQPISVLDGIGLRGAEMGPHQHSQSFMNGSTLGHSASAESDSGSGGGDLARSEEDYSIGAGEGPQRDPRSASIVRIKTEYETAYREALAAKGALSEMAALNKIK